MNKLTLSIKDSSISFVLSYILSQVFIVLLIIFGSIFFAVLGKNYETLTNFFNSAFGYLIIATCVNLSFILAYFFYKSKREIEPESKFNLKKLFIYIIVGLLSYILLYPIISLISHLISLCGIKTQSLTYTLSTSNYLISIISLVILPAICEELLFRGIIFKGLKKHGKIFAVTISSLMFAIFHMSVNQLVYPIIMGMLFAVIMYYENNIIYCIAIHLLNNFISLTLSYTGTSLFNTSSLYIIFALIFACIFISTLLYFLFKKDKLNTKTKSTNVEKLYLASSFVIMLLFYVIISFST